MDGFAQTPGMKTIVEIQDAISKLSENEQGELLRWLEIQVGMVARLSEKKVRYPILAYDALMDKPGEEHTLRLAGPNLKVSCLYCPFTVEQFYEVLSKLLASSLQFQNSES